MSLYLLSGLTTFFCSTISFEIPKAFSKATNASLSVLGKMFKSSPQILKPIRASQAQSVEPSFAKKCMALFILLVLKDSLAVNAQTLLPNSPLEAREGNYYTQFWITSDFFLANETVTARQQNGLPLPNGLSCVNNPIQTLGTLSVYGLTAAAKFDSVVYGISSAYSNSILSINISDPTNFQQPVLTALNNKQSYLNFHNINCQSRFCYLEYLSIEYSAPFLAITKIDPKRNANAPTIVSTTVVNLPEFAGIGGFTINEELGVGVYIYQGALFNPKYLLEVSLVLFNATDPNYSQISNLTLSSYAPNSPYGISGAEVNNIVIEKNSITVAVGKGFLNVDMSNYQQLNIIGSFLFFGAFQAVSLLKSDSANFVSNTAEIALMDNRILKSPVLASMITSALTATLRFNPVTMTTFKNYLFVSGSSLMAQFDVGDIYNPALVTSFQQNLSPGLGLYISGNSLILPDTQIGMIGMTRGESFSLLGTLAGETSGNYTLEFDASETTVLAFLQVASEIVTSGPLPNQSCVAGIFCFKTLPSNAFRSMNGAQLVYSANQDDGRPLPDGLTIDIDRGAINGVPATPATYNFIITAKDPISGAIGSLGQEYTIYAGQAALTQLSPPAPFDAPTLSYAVVGAFVLVVMYLNRRYYFTNCRREYETSNEEVIAGQPSIVQFHDPENKIKRARIYLERTKPYRCCASIKKLFSENFEGKGIDLLYLGPILNQGWHKVYKIPAIDKSLNNFVIRALGAGNVALHHVSFKVTSEKKGFDHDAKYADKDPSVYSSLIDPLEQADGDGPQSSLLGKSHLHISIDGDENSEEDS